MEALTKLGSRKLWVTLLALLGVVWQGNVGAEWWQQAIVCAVAAVYVLVEGWADARGRSNPLEDYGDDTIERLEEITRALRLGLERGRELDPLEGPPGDVGGLASPAAARVDPQLVVALVQLLEQLIGLFAKRKRR